MMKNDWSRRRFLQLVTIGSGSVLFLPRCTVRPVKFSWRFFTEKEAALINVIIDQIIPADEWPGARDAKVCNFIDKQLVSTYIRYQKIYRKGLEGMKTSCKILYQKQFEELSWDDQTLFLKNMDAGRLSDLLKGNITNQQENNIWSEEFDKTFFTLIRDHTMQGFYGSPRHGGNLNYVSYKMIGLDYPFINGQNRYKFKI
jgi:gluconate 2-dehydrogenase gamma chain